MLSSPEDYLMVRGVIAVGDAFGLEVVAEGMATHEHGAELYAAGCNVMQGYGIARPMPFEEVSKWHREFKPDSRWKLVPASRSSVAVANDRVH